MTREKKLRYEDLSPKERVTGILEASIAGNGPVLSYPITIVLASIVVLKHIHLAPERNPYVKGNSSSFNKNQ